MSGILSDVFKCQSLEQLLETTKVKEIAPEGQKVFSIPSDTPISKVLELLASNRILSAPVFNEKETDPKKKYLGFIDMFDILKYIISIYSENREIGEGHQLHVWCQDIGKLEHKGEEFAHIPIKECIDISKIDPFCSVYSGSLLPQLLYIFRKGLHRVAVMDENANLVNIVSQSDVVQFLAKHIHYYPGKLAFATVGEIGLGQKKHIVSVTPQARAIHAFHQMITAGVSAVAVVDQQGCLLANLSISDLRGIGQSTLPDLLLSVEKFLEKYRSRRSIPPLTVTDSTTFETVVLKLAATRVHRLWLIDQQTRPKGIISLTDINLLLDLRVYIDQSEVIWSQQFEP